MMFSVLDARLCESARTGLASNSMEPSDSVQLQSSLFSQAALIECRGLAPPDADSGTHQSQQDRLQEPTEPD